MCAVHGRVECGRVRVQCCVRLGCEMHASLRIAQHPHCCCTGPPESPAFLMKQTHAGARREHTKRNHAVTTVGGLWVVCDVQLIFIYHGPISIWPRFALEWRMRLCVGMCAVPCAVQREQNTHAYNMYMQLRAEWGRYNMLLLCVVSRERDGRQTGAGLPRYGYVVCGGSDGTG